MAELHVISALRDKRSELAGIVNRLQQQLAEHRASLAHLGATMLLFDPDIRPRDRTQAAAVAQQLVSPRRMPSPDLRRAA